MWRIHCLILVCDNYREYSIKQYTREIFYNPSLLCGIITLFLSRRTSYINNRSVVPAWHNTPINFDEEKHFGGIYTNNSLVYSVTTIRFPYRKLYYDYDLELLRKKGFLHLARRVRIPSFMIMSLNQYPYVYLHIDTVQYICSIQCSILCLNFLFDTFPAKCYVK
jgi:hypothetical protein